MFASYTNIGNKGNTVKNSKEKIITADFMNEIKSSFTSSNIVKSIEKFYSVYDFVYAYRSSKKGQNQKLLAERLNEPSININDFIFLNTGDFIILYNLGMMDRFIFNYNLKLKEKFDSHIINQAEYKKLLLNIDDNELIKFIIMNTSRYFLSLENYSALDISRLTKSVGEHDKLYDYLKDKFIQNYNLCCDYTPKQ